MTTHPLPISGRCPYQAGGPRSRGDGFWSRPLRALFPIAVAIMVGTWGHGAPGQSLERAEDAVRPAGPSPKVLRYCQRVLEQLGAEVGRGLPLELWPAGHGDAGDWDTDGDGHLSARELASRIQEYARNRSLRMLAAPPPPRTADPREEEVEKELTGEDLLQRGENGPRGTGDAPETELGTSVPAGAATDAIYQVAPSRLAAGVPPWFSERDRDGDGQLTLAEFAPEPTGAAIREFRRLDWNNDGVITLEEARRGPRAE
jgi:hypothetical protein